jgi:hypothetical protein
MVGYITRNSTCTSKKKKEILHAVQVESQEEIILKEGKGTKAPYTDLTRRIL